VVRSGVSIPQSGFGAFGPDCPIHGAPGLAVSIPQSGFGAFEPTTPPVAAIRGNKVSIPQSGFGAFELESPIVGEPVLPLFQSLSRDSGRLNARLSESNHTRSSSFNPSVGIRGV